MFLWLSWRLTWLLAMLLSAAPASGAELRLLSPSLSYCDELSARLSRLPKARQDTVREEVLEGERLCGTGYVRTGVAKLRRALREAQGDLRGDLHGEAPSHAQGGAGPLLAEPARP